MFKSHMGVDLDDYREVRKSRFLKPNNYSRKSNASEIVVFDHGSDLEEEEKKDFVTKPSERTSSL